MHYSTLSAISRSSILLALLALPLSPAFAQWTGKGEAGIAVASGNTDTKTANAKIAVGKKVEAWEYSAGFGTLYIRNDGATTAKRWELGGQTRYSFSGNTFWYGGLRYEEDRFSGFDHQGVVSTGVGRKFIDNDTTKFSGQVGVGYKFYETIDTLLAPGSKDSNIAGVAGLDFEHKLNSFTTVFDRFGAEVTSDNNFLQNEIGLAVKMSDRMALALAYAVRHNTDPPAGFKKTDTLSTINLVYEVK
jgi:putative salt-induced outer membrane protein